MTKSLALTDAAGMNIGRSYRLCTPAGVYKDLGRLDEALIVITQSLATRYEQEELYYEAETHRAKRELLLKQDDLNAAEAKSCRSGARL